MPLPLKIKDKLRIQVKKIKEIHQKDLENGFGSVYIPYALERKFPKAKYETKWQYLFPMNKISNIRSIQELLGHKSIETTMIYTHIVKELNKSEIRSPLDF